MAKSKAEKQQKVPGAKKALRNKISTVLQESFPEIRSVVGKKQFSKKVQQATKVLAAGYLAKEKKARKKQTASARKSAAASEHQNIPTETAIEPSLGNISTAGELEIAPPAK